MSDGAPHSLEITTRSGSVLVRVTDVARPTVVDGNASIDDDGVVHSTSSGRVEVCCPAGTDVVIGTLSGSVECRGALGRVVVSTRSGKVHIDDAAEADVRTLSGSVELESCSGECQVVTKSAAVGIGAAADASVTSKSGTVEIGAVVNATVRSASGKVRVDMLGGGAVDVRTMSGRVDVHLPAEQSPVVALHSRSGSVSGAGLPGTEQGGSLSVDTLSGAITVTRR